MGNDVMTILEQVLGRSRTVPGVRDHYVSRIGAQAAPDTEDRSVSLIRIRMIRTEKDRCVNPETTRMTPAVEAAPDGVQGESVCAPIVEPSFHMAEAHPARRSTARTVARR
jgi:hypothetical protein